MNSARLEFSFFGVLTLVVAILATPWSIGPAFGEDSLSACSQAIQRWESSLSQLEAQYKEFQAVKRTPLAEIVKRPLVDRSREETIARQVAKAIQAREELLGKKRKEFISLMNGEKEAAAEVDRCVDSAGLGRKAKRALRQLSRLSDSLHRKAVDIVADVVEVRGKDDYSQYYVDSSRPNYGYQGNYWQQQQQMFMRYWGR